jgi:hypothetical protein
MQFDDVVSFEHQLELSDLSSGLDRLDQMDPKLDALFRMPNFATGLSKLVNAPEDAAEGKNVNIYVIGTGLNNESLHPAEDGSRSIVDEFGYRADRVAMWDGTKMMTCSAEGDQDCGRDFHGAGTMMASLSAGGRYGVAMEAKLHGVKVSGIEDAELAKTNIWSVAHAIDYIIRNGVYPAVISIIFYGIEA